MNAEHYRRSFLAHRKALQGFYADLPDEHRDFAAWDGGMSFLQQGDHLALSSRRLLTMMDGSEAEKLVSATTLAEVRERLQQSSDVVTAAIAGLDEAQLARTVTVFGGMQMTVAALLDMLIGHEAHHKGQVWQMARMVGLTPPRYVQLG